MESKIKVVFDGGFGNQLFQLAFVNFLRQAENIICFNKDFYNFRGRKLNNYTLLFFKENDLNESAFQFKRFVFFVFRMANKFKVKKIGKFYFDAFPFNLYGNNGSNPTSVLYSYFQNVDFDFVLTYNPFKTLKFTNKTSVLQQKCFIHIRGGDYLTPQNIKFYAQLNHDYYSKAIHLINKEYNVQQFVVFTNDKKYASSVLDKVKTASDINLIFPENTSANEDFIEMSNMQYGILSNSTFSFWSVVCNYSTKKKIVAPIQWYVKQSRPSFLNKNWWYA